MKFELGLIEFDHFAAQCIDKLDLFDGREKDDAFLVGAFPQETEQGVKFRLQLHLYKPILGPFALLKHFLPLRHRLFDRFFQKVGLLFSHLLLVPLPFIFAFEVCFITGVQVKRFDHFVALRVPRQWLLFPRLVEQQRLQVLAVP